MKIYTLMDNESYLDGYWKEHGLSFYIETENHKILFDFGQTDKFIANAKRLGIDLSLVDIAVLSHGHYDHGGGIEKFIQVNQLAKIYINQYAFRNYYHGTDKYIGLDMRLKNHDRFVFIDKNLIVDDELEIKGSHFIPHYPLDSAGLLVKLNEDYQEDCFLHEMYLMIHENKNVLLSGCAHKGVLNIMRWFSPDIFVGGFHLKKQEIINHSHNNLDKIAKELLNYSTIYYTGHCTGLKQYEYLKEIMKDQLFYLSAGTMIEIK